MALPISGSRTEYLRKRRRSPVLAALLLVLLAGATAAGYQLGLNQRELPYWDPLVLRAAFNRPIDTALPGTGPWVAGYYVPYDSKSLRAVQSRAVNLDQVITFSYGVGPDGSLSGADPDVLRGIIRGEKTILLFANIVDGKFSADAVRILLSNPSARATAIRNIVTKVEQRGAAGAQMDFEAVPNSQRAELTAMIRDLGQALREKGKTLSIAVPAKTADNPRSTWSGAFDYAALGEAADQIYIMAYDQHYKGGPPGPVASLPWTEQVVRYAVYTIPAGKIMLGIPGYGYDWGQSGTKARGWPAMLEHLKQMNAEIKWDGNMAENVATYGGEEPRTVWFPDERSVAAKFKLAQSYNLKGIALWRLGFESDDYWTQVFGFHSDPQ